MGTVIDLLSWREGERDRDRLASPDPDAAVDRLDRLVSRLDPLLESVKRGGKRDHTVETDILAITGAISLGLMDEAAVRAERLASRLEARTKHAQPDQG